MYVQNLIVWAPTRICPVFFSPLVVLLPPLVLLSLWFGVVLRVSPQLYAETMFARECWYHELTNHYGQGHNLSMCIHAYVRFREMPRPGSIFCWGGMFNT